MSEPRLVIPVGRARPAARRIRTATPQAKAPRASSRRRIRSRLSAAPRGDHPELLLPVGRLDGFVAKVSGTELLLTETREPRFGDP